MNTADFGPLIGVVPIFTLPDDRSDSVLPRLIDAPVCGPVCATASMEGRSGGAGRPLRGRQPNDRARRRWVGVVQGSEPPPGMAFSDWAWRENPFLDHCVIAEFDRIIFDPAISLDMPRSRRGRLRSWTMADIGYGLTFDPLDSPIDKE